MAHTDQNVIDEQEEQDKTDLSGAAMIHYLTPDNAVFTRTEGSMLSVRVKDEQHPVVYLHCSFPHTNKTIYISVRTIENKEIGMIKSLNDFPKDTAELLEEQTRIRYFSPVITKVSNIKEEFGYSYWETETSAGVCRFTVRSGGANVKWVSEQKLLIIDVDGNRFTIENMNRLSEKEYKMVEMCM